MKLIVKFNFALLGVLIIGMVVIGYFSHGVLVQHARDEVIQNARIMMASSLANRTYTSTQISPLLETQMKYEFLPQSIPAYGATEQFNELRKLFPDFFYKEATLNPTNPRDRASDWEADIVNLFRQNPDRQEMSGERDTPAGRSIYLARPLQIKSPACLNCHSTIDVAPKTMLDKYGSSNGFGWKLNEIIGAQILSVPMNISLKIAEDTFRSLMMGIGAIFLLLFVAINLMLQFIVIKPMSRMTPRLDEAQARVFALE